MRRGGTTLVVVVVAAIALAAGFDALRGGERAGRRAASRRRRRTTTPDDPAEEPAARRPSSAGRSTTRTRTASSGRSSCCGRAAVDPPNWDECRFVLSPDGAAGLRGRHRLGSARGRARGRLFQSADGTIQVSDRRRPGGRAVRGHGPGLEAGRDADVLRGRGRAGVAERRRRPLATRARAGAANTAFPELATRYDRFGVREAAWLDDRRLAAILSADGPEFGRGHARDLRRHRAGSVHLRRSRRVVGAAGKSRADATSPRSRGGRTHRAGSS